MQPAHLMVLICILLFVAVSLFRVFRFLKK
jgi:hypothetical protein